MSKIYIVKSASGEYEDYYVWNEKAFNKKEDAEAYAKQLDEEHNRIPQFITDEFIEILADCEYELPDWDDVPEDILNDKEKRQQWAAEQQKKQNELLFELMYKRGQFMTQEMYNQYLEWDSNSYTVWHDCQIEELELV